MILMSSIGGHGKSWQLAEEHLAVTEELCRVQLKALGQHMPEFNLNDHMKYISALQSDQMYKELFVTRIKVLRIHNELKQWASEPVQVRELQTVPGITFDREMLSVQLPSSRPTIITYGMFLNVLDKLEAQFTTYLATILFDTHESLDGIDFKTIYLDFNTILEQGYKEHGNEFTDLLKAMEGIIVGFILKNLPTGVHDRHYGDNMRNDFKKKRPEQIEIWDNLILVLTRALNDYGHRVLPYLYQLYTHEKLHYFPMGSSSLGIAKMMAFGTKASGLFVLEYIYGYHAKHKVLPPVLLGSIDNPIINSYFLNQQLPSKKDAHKQSLMDWAQIRFEKHIDFIYHADISDWLDDKSTAPYYEQLIHKYASDPRKIFGGKKHGDKPLGRMILRLLAQEDIDVKLFFEIVEELKAIRESWRTIILIAKEMERKLLARMFSVLTLECRMMASVCEHNLADYILPYFDEQTMTDNGSEVKAKIDLLSTLKASPDETWVAINMDFEQWNYTIRDYAVSPLCNVLNSMFGVDHYQTIQWIFRDGVLVSGDPYLPPTRKDKLTAYRGHLGGNQGIFQKLWTTLTICLIKIAMLTFKYKYHQIGAGDNQVLLVCLKKSDMIHYHIKTIQDHLEAVFSGSGMRLNKSECWYSDQLFLYQRKGYLSGVPCPLVLKMASRASSGIADVDCGFEAIISTSTNAGMTINEVSPSVLIGYIFSSLENQIATSVSYPWSKIADLTIQQRVIFYMLPSDMGFPSNLPLMNYLYSGHKDTMSDLLALLSIIWDNEPHYRPDISSALHMEIGKLDVDSQTQLLEAPQTLNIRSPPSMIAVIKKNVETFLRTDKLVKNNVLKIMFSSNAKHQKQALMKNLLTLDPLNTEICNTLVSESAFGQNESFMAKFNSITSIVKLTGQNRIASGKQSLAEIVTTIDRDLILFIMKKLKTPRPTHSTLIETMTHHFQEQYLQYCSVHGLNPQCQATLFTVLESVNP